MGKNFSQLPRVPTWCLLSLRRIASSMTENVAINSVHEVVARINADKGRVLAYCPRV
jgi:hypothetical protein